MTREKLWEIVTTRLVWVDYWNGESEPSGEIKEILTNSLLIPKSKFRVGDKVKDEFNDTHYIYECCYDLSKNRWWYFTLYGNKFYESELKLVEEGK